MEQLHGKYDPWKPCTGSVQCEVHPLKSERLIYLGDNAAPKKKPKSSASRPTLQQPDGAFRTCQEDSGCAVVWGVECRALGFRLRVGVQA